jgi:hypothetical protein
MGFVQSYYAHQDKYITSLLLVKAFLRLRKLASSFSLTYHQRFGAEQARLIRTGPYTKSPSCLGYSTTSVTPILVPDVKAFWRSLSSLSPLAVDPQTQSLAWYRTTDGWRVHRLMETLFRRSAAVVLSLYIGLARNLILRRRERTLLQLQRCNPELDLADPSLSPKPRGVNENLVMDTHLGPEKSSLQGNPVRVR